MDRNKNFREQSTDELKAIYFDLCKEIFAMRNEISTTRKIDKPHLVRLKKRNRARVLTLLKQKGETL